MKSLNQSVFIGLAAASLTLAPISSQAELKVQNSQYKAKKNVLYVKGKIKGNSVKKVYVVNSMTGTLIAALDTTSRGRHFRANITMGSADSVPCSIKVQTNFLVRGRFGRFGAQPSGGEFSIKRVRKAPSNCVLD